MLPDERRDLAELRTAETTVMATKEGTFPFDCSIAGHKEAGMKGSAVVAGASTAPSTTSPQNEAAPGTSDAEATPTLRSRRPRARAVNPSPIAWKTAARSSSSLRST